MPVGLCGPYFEGWGQGSADWGEEFQGYHDFTPNSEVRRWGFTGEGDAARGRLSGRQEPTRPLTCQRLRARGGEGAVSGKSGSPPPTALGGWDPDPPVLAPPSPPVTSAPVDHSTPPPAGSPGAHWPVGGGRREWEERRETPRQAVAMDALASSNHGCGGDLLDRGGGAGSEGGWGGGGVQPKGGATVIPRLSCGT